MHYPSPLPPQRMPGPTGTAVVLLWVMLGLGACGSLAAPLLGYLAEAWTDDGLQPGLGAAIAVIALVLAACTVLRGVLAVKIKRRSHGARKGAILLEAAGLALTAAAWFVTTALIGPVARTTETASGLETTTSTGPDPTTVASSLPGVVLSVLIIVLLSLPDSKRWCESAAASESTMRGAHP